MGITCSEEKHDLGSINEKLKGSKWMLAPRRFQSGVFPVIENSTNGETRNWSSISNKNLKDSKKESSSNKEKKCSSREEQRDSPNHALPHNFSGLRRRDESSKSLLKERILSTKKKRRRVSLTPPKPTLPKPDQTA